MLSLNAVRTDSAYVDKASIADEIAATRRLCARHGWPVIDVTHRSIEETAAEILALLNRDEADTAAQPVATAP
jgi:hypothetical protein